ncbi:MAG: chorismate pyruvate-lyase family protein [Pseudomonadota bacterium]
MTRLLSRHAIVNDRSLSLFQKILLTTDGTVTDLLSLYTGEIIRVKKLEQSITRDRASAALKVPPETPLLKRKVLLAGRTRHYLYAESFFVLERLSRSTQHKLLNSDHPIGTLWKEERAEMYRELIQCKLALCDVVSRFFGLRPQVPILSRTCLIFHNRKPLGIITESFPSTYFRNTPAGLAVKRIATT